MRSSILSAAVAALNGLVDLKSSGVELESLDKILSDIHEIEKWLRTLPDDTRSGAEQAPAPRASLSLETTDESGSRSPAEVRVITQGEAGETNILREQTGLDGRLELALDAGRDYRIEIKKGFEYPIHTQTIRLEAGEHGEITHRLVLGVDLGAMGWYGGDLHHHSSFSDGVDSPAEVYNSMLAAGLSFGALSDHNTTDQQKIWDAFRTDSFLPVLSNEISTGYGHVMNMSRSLEAGMGKYITFEDGTLPFGQAGSETSVLGDPSAESRLREAFVRLTSSIRAAGGISQINHPVDVTENTTFPRALYDELNMFDCFELLNSGSPTIKGFPNDEGINLWFESLSKGRFIAASAGSDNHNNRRYEFTDEMLYFHSLARAFPLMDRWPERFRNTGRFLRVFYENLFPKIEKWMLEGMGTGSSRVYVHTGMKQSGLAAPELFDALKKGSSFVSSGPILLPEINGRIPGETVHGESARINVRLYSNKPLSSLQVLTGNRQVIAARELTNPETREFYQYRVGMDGFDLRGHKFLVFVTQTDHTNMAISNPVFIVN